MLLITFPLSWFFFFILLDLSSSESILATDLFLCCKYLLFCGLSPPLSSLSLFLLSLFRTLFLEEMSVIHSEADSKLSWTSRSPSFGFNNYHQSCFIYILAYFCSSLHPTDYFEINFKHKNSSMNISAYVTDR